MCCLVHRDLTSDFHLLQIFNVVLDYVGVLFSKHNTNLIFALTVSSTNVDILEV